MLTVTRFFLIIIATVSTIVALFGNALAHDSRPLFVEINALDENRVRIQWRAPPTVSPENFPSVALDTPCTLETTTATAARQSGFSVYTCADNLSGAHLSISYPYYNPSLATLVRVKFANGELHTKSLSPETKTYTLPEPENFSSVASSYFVIGIEHIVYGYDHLLFLAGLLYIARTPRRVLITVTGFTIAHSVTIFLTALNLIRVSVPAVETVIALSIVFLAAEIARNNRDTLTWRHPVLVASAFGLVHGAGFASALAEIGLPQTEKVAGLLFFNIGVEAGQLLIIAAGFAVIFAARKLLPTQLPAYDAPSLRRACGYSIGIFAAFWFVERFIGAVA